MAELRAYTRWSSQRLNRLPRNHLEGFEPNANDEDRCYTFCTMSLLFRIRHAGDGDSTAKQYKRTSSTTGREFGSRLTDRHDVKQICHTPGPSDVLIGNSATLGDLLKLCGSDLKPENRRKCERRVVLLRWNNAETGGRMNTSSDGRQQIKLNGSDTRAQVISIPSGRALAIHAQQHRESREWGQEGLWRTLIKVHATRACDENAWTKLHLL